MLWRYVEEHWVYEKPQSSFWKLGSNVRLQTCNLCFGSNIKPTMDSKDQPNLDHLHLAQDSTVLSIIHSQDHFNSTVRYSAQCQVLSFNYDKYVLHAKADIVLLLTDVALYILPPLQNGIIQCDSYDRFPVEDIALLSLPYSFAVASGGHSDYALRTDDFALHMHNCRTLWIRAPHGHRSELGQIFAEVFSAAVPGLDLELNHCDYKELLQWIADSTIKSFVTQIKCTQFTKQSHLFQGWLDFYVFKISAFSPENSIAKLSKVSPGWQRRWFYLTIHDLWHFSSEDEVESFKYALSTPKSRRASLPKLGRIALSQEITSKELVLADNIRGFSIKSVEEDRVYLFVSQDFSKSNEEWIQVINNRSNISLETLP